MIEYHPYDLDIDGETDVNRRHIEQIEKATRGKDEIRFAVISDTQRWYDETEDAVEALNRRGDLDFVVHTGDLSDFGLKLEFEKQRDILNGLNVPYVCLLGNHDCLATGLDVYRKIFGTEDFAFTAGNVRFLCLNTNALEFEGLSIDPNAREVRLDGQLLDLTKIEFDLLTKLASEPRRVFARQQLLDAVWGADWYGDDHVVDVHMGNLRKKLGESGSNPRFIHTVRGVGFRFEATT